ncbi:MAG: HEAT repeat domain-containing protein [Planctomycetota bacterium]
MRTNTCVILSVTLLAAGLALSGSSECEAADVGELIKIIETPKTPAERHPHISAHEWKEKDAGWARLRASARQELTDIGAPAVGPLVDLIKRTNDDSVKIMALTALGLMKNPADLVPTGDLMVELLDEKNPGLRYLAAKTLGVMKLKRAAPKLNGLLADKEDVVRMIAADALGEIDDYESAAPLLKLVDYGKGGEDNAEKKSVRLHVLAALGNLGPALKVVPKLIEKLESDDLNEREVAVEAVEQLLGYEITADGRWLIAHEEAKRVPVIKDFADWWAKTLKDKRFRIARKPDLTLRVNILRQQWQLRKIRLKALEVIGEIGDKAAVNYLILAMYTEDKILRTAVAKVAMALSGIKIEYLPTDTEEQWNSKVESFRQKWREAGN